MTIEYKTQDRRIKEGSFKRTRQQINEDLIEKEIHRNCYIEESYGQQLLVLWRRPDIRKYIQESNAPQVVLWQTSFFNNVNVFFRFSCSINTNHSTTETKLDDQSILTAPPVFDVIENETENEISLLNDSQKVINKTMCKLNQFFNFRNFFPIDRNCYKQHICYHSVRSLMLVHSMTQVNAEE